MIAHAHGDIALKAYIRVKLWIDLVFASESLLHSGLKKDSIFKPGCTATEVFGKWSGSFDDKVNNKKGGFSWILMQGRRGRRILIITYYQVSQVSSVGLEDTNTT